MAKFRALKNSLIAGQISPTSYGRVDLPQYAHACRTLKNAIPLPGGGAYRRPGTFYENSLSASVDYIPRLFPFVFSKTESYMLYIGKVIGGNGVFDGFRTTSNTTTSTDLSGVSLLNYPPYLQPNATSTTGFYDEVNDVHTTQSADVMWLVHPLYKPKKITRTAVNTFVWHDFDEVASGVFWTGAKRRDSWAYRPINATAITMTPSGTTGSITITASSAFFNSGHVGSLIKINHAGTYGCAEITGFTSSTVVNATTVVDFGSTGAVTTWWESAWSDYRGWPRTCAFFQNRLVFGGNSSEPDTMWFSETDDYDQFSVDSITDPRDTSNVLHPFTSTFASQQVNQIQWMIGGQTLITGTIGDEWVTTRQVESAGFGADNVQNYVVSRYGSAHIQAVRAGNELLFVTSSGEEVRALVFNDNEKSYVAEPLQVLFDNHPRPEQAVSTTYSSGGSRKIKTISWDETRKALWCLDTMGNWFGMTRDRTLGVTAWHTHEMGGFDSTLTQTPPTISTYPASDPAYRICSGSVLSMAVVPNPVTGKHDVWFVVKRKVNGAFSYYFERMIGDCFRNDSAYTLVTGSLDSYYTDSSVHDSIGDTAGAGSDSISMGHLKGESPVGIAQVYEKGLFKISFSPVDTTTGYGTITGSKPPSFTSTAYSVHAGLPFTTVIEPVRIEAGSQIGTSFGAVQRIHQAVLRFYNTIGCKVGSNSSNLETIIFRNANVFLGKSAELYTGEKLIKLDSEYDRDGYIYIVQEDPLPFCLVSVVAEGQTYD